MAMKDWVVPEEVFARELNLGQKRERERIIKLLEKLSNAYYKTGVGSAIETAAYEKAIALIKGENK